MRIIALHGMPSITSRFLATILFLAVICMASDSYAQLRQRWLARGTRVKQTDRQLDVPASGNLHERTFKGEVQPRYNPFEANRNYEPRNWRFEQSNEPFPKYIGGFHSSYYSNLGVPNGDIGFRGNGIYWPPW